MVDDSMSDKSGTLPAAGMTRAVSSMSLTEVAASAAARAFFYPSVLWNIARSHMQSDWAWWNQITDVSGAAFLTNLVFAVATIGRSPVR